MKGCGRKTACEEQERGGEPSTLCIQSSIDWIMAAVDLHRHCFRNSKMATARAMSPYIGVAVTLGVIHPRAESVPLRSTGRLVPEGSNWCCLESMSTKWEQNLFSLFHLSQRALTFLKVTCDRRRSSPAQCKTPTLAFFSSYQ